MFIMVSIQRSRSVEQLLLAISSAEALAVSVDIVVHGSGRPDELRVEDP